MFDFGTLEAKYGPGGAQEILLQIERAAKISQAYSEASDFETRLINALRAQDAMTLAAA